jgi:hypothetical protein
MLEMELNSFNTELVYSDIAREPDKYTGEFAAYNGKVLQIMQGNNLTQMRVAVDGDSDKTLFCEYYPESETINILENDWITVYGQCMGEYSYESVLGATITLPAMMVCRIVEYDNSVQIEYDKGPFTFTENTYSGKRVTEIESFEITHAAQAYSGSTSLTIEYTIIGTLSGYNYLSIDVKCYDSDGFLLDTSSISSSVADGERFKISNDFYAPLGTVRIEFAGE